MPQPRKKTLAELRRMGRKYRKKNKTTRRLSEVNLGKSVIPLSTRTRLTYLENDFSLYSAVGVAVRDSYSFVGMYDPDLTGGGHQPMGFDQMMELYDHYQVLNAVITIIVTHNDGPMVIGLITSNTQTPPTSLNALNTFQESPSTQYRYLLQDTNNSGPVIIKKKLNIAKFYGLKQSQLKGTTKYQGTSTLNPTETGAFHVFAWALNGGSQTLRYTVKLEFDSVFTEPKAIAGS